jgi:hypothetical protein
MYRDGKHSKMTATRIQELEGLGFEFEPLELAWKERLGELKDFCHVAGHCNVSGRHKDNRPLAEWVKQQRANYKLYQDGKSSSMTATRIQQLEGLGFEWEPLVLAWEERLAELKGFRDTHGHCNVPSGYKGNPSLGKWLANQRAKYKLYRGGKPSSMTATRIQQLEDLGFEWETPESAWEDRLADLMDFCYTHGHCNVPQWYKDNPPLAQWVKQQQANYKLYRDGKPSTMTAARIQQLQDLGFKWGEPLELSWEERLAELKDYTNTHGHCNVPYACKDNPPLAMWVCTQRRQYRRHRDAKTSGMTAQRIKQLDDVGFEWDPREAAWNEHLAELEDFCDAHGHCNVPISYKANPALAQWVKKQRDKYRLYRDGKRSCMTASRIQQLKELGFEWVPRAAKRTRETGTRPDTKRGKKNGP